MKCNAGLTNQVEVIQPQALLQSEEISEVHVCTQIIKVRITTQIFRQSARRQPTQLLTLISSNNTHLQWLTNIRPRTTNQLPHMVPATITHHVTSSLDIVGEVTLKTSVDGYKLLKVNEMIKNAVTWRARMPKMSKFLKYFDNNTKEGTQGIPEPKVHINEAMLEVMGQAAKDFRYMEQEFVKAVEMYQYFSNQNLEDVSIPNSQD